LHADLRCRYDHQGLGRRLGGILRPIAGAIIAEVVGWLLPTTGSHVLVFGMFSVAFVVAWLVLRIGIRTIRHIAL
jgi:hypothetical protein